MKEEELKSCFSVLKVEDQVQLLMAEIREMKVREGQEFALNHGASGQQY